jgi:predicted nicotinamide N-methyase
MAKPTKLPETPWEALTPLTRQTLTIDDRTFVLDRPPCFDKIFEHPAMYAAWEADEYLPYWADLWPVSLELAKAVLRELWPENATVLELGCGLGLPGIAALMRGLSVIFSDIDATAVQFAGRNARLNGFQNFELLQFDWREPPDDLNVPVILGSDLTFERRHIEPLIQLIDKVLEPDGLCMLVDQNRPPAALLRDLLPDWGFEYQCDPIKARSPDQPTYKGSIYRIRRSPKRR